MSDTDRTPLLLSPPGPRVVIDGAECDYFGGTSYLGLHGHPEVLDAMGRAVHTFGVHTATSRTRLLSPAVENLEQRAAEFFGTAAAYSFASGYLGNAMLVRTLIGAVDTVWCDAQAHGSLREAGTLLGVPVHSFRSRDTRHLEEQLRDCSGVGARPLLLTDGVFAASGHLAPLDHYVALLERYPGAVLLVDDAHGFGTLGTAGRGTLEHFGLWERANRGLEPTGLTVLVTGTLSKALGGFGGILPGSTALLRAVQRANAAHAGASALPAPVAAAGARALQVLGAAPQLRSALQHNAHYVRQGLRGLGLPVDDLPTPVVGFTWRDAAAMRGLHRALLQAGSFVPYLDDYAGVGPDGAMRVAVCATHTTVQIDRLLTRLTASLRG